MEFLLKHKIRDRGQLAAIRKNAEDELAVLVKQRQRLYRREPDSLQFAVFTGQIKQLRKTVRICKQIEIHSLEIEQRMQAAQMEEQWRREQREKEGQQKEARNRDNQKKEMII